LPEDWLNDSVKGFVGPTATTDEFMQLGALKVTVVSPEYLLAMKLMSARVSDRDIADVGFGFNLPIFHFHFSGSY
jgi:hypothetical protein